MHPENLEAGREFGTRHGFEVCTGTHYLGGYIGGDKSKRDWLREHTLTWEENISTISESPGKYPQDSYATVVHAIQSEWIFLQHVTWDTGDALLGVENMIQETFLPRIFFRKTKNLSPIVGALSMMSIKMA